MTGRSQGLNGRTASFADASNEQTLSPNLADHLSTCACDACMNADRFKDDTDRAGLPQDGGTASAGETATLQQMADFIENGYWNNGTGLRHNLGTSGPDANNGVLHYNVSGFDELLYGGGSDADGVTAARAEIIRDVFDVYEAVLGIDFVETTSTDNSVVDFFFSDNKSGAYAGSTRYSDGTIYYSYINVAESWSGGTSTYDDYTLQTIFHEIGHALGLGHQGDYNGSGGYATDAQFTLDSWQATMMSYFSQSENTAIDASYELLQTPMAVDWLALDSIYGQFGYGVENAFAGDTVYGFNTNISAAQSDIWNQYAEFANRTASTIVDGSGNDTLDVSGYSANQKIDLTVQSADQTYQDSSDIGGRVGNLTLAVGTVIENAIGGAGDDLIIGNAADNQLSGGAGNDTFVATLGNDTYFGGSGFDAIIYGAAFTSYTFALLDSAIEVVGSGIDLVLDTVESFQFSDVTYSFGNILDLFGNAGPEAQNDTTSVAEGAVVVLDVLSNDTDADGDDLEIAMIEGQTVAAGDTINLASGAMVSLNADGTLTYDQNTSFDALEDGETGTDTFSYSVSDGNGGTDTASVSVTIDGESPVVAGPIGQSGTATIVQQNASQWHSVTFDAVIENAVVVMGPVSFNGGQQVTTRVRDVTDTGFQFQIDEWDYLDAYHIEEDIGWLALSEGTHTLAGGQTVVAGSQTVGTGFSSVDFGNTLGSAVVLAEVSSVNEENAVATRIRNVDGNGFQVKLQEEEAGGTHANELVSWIAIETGTAAELDVVLTPRQLDHRADSFDFNTDFEVAPVLLADMQTTFGNDASTVRMQSLSDTGTALFVEEEKSRDSELWHTTEAVGYVAMAEGLIYDEFVFA